MYVCMYVYVYIYIIYDINIIWRVNYEIAYHVFKCFIENVHHGILLQLNISQISGMTGGGNWH